MRGYQSDTPKYTLEKNKARISEKIFWGGAKITGAFRPSAPAGASPVCMGLTDVDVLVSLGLHEVD